MPAARRRAKDQTVVLTDPRAIRALAHPARLSLLSELDGDVELTATELAGRAGISASAMSYHLRALEKVGIVRRAAARADGRERPWRATNHSIQVTSSSPAATAPAEELLIGMTLDRARRAFGDWLRTQEGETDAWRDIASVRWARIWLTAEEAQRLSRDLEALLAPYSGRRTAARRPEGAREVETVSVIVPRPATTADVKRRRRSAGA